LVFQSIPENFTKFGDGACDIEPIGDLYKSNVRQIAGFLGIPKEIIMKPASPDLWPEQTAKTELGADYDTLDLILYGLEHWWSINEITKALDVSKELVEKTYNRWKRTEHKRRTPLIPKLFLRTVGHDFRLPYNADQI
jgi:NAD+ synthase